MKIYLQINFSSGIGDFYTYFCEAYFLSKRLKEKNYNTILYFNTNRDVDLLTLFETSYYQYFDEVYQIKSPKNKKDFGDYKILFPHESWDSGLHCWEVFVPVEFSDFIEFTFVNFSRFGMINFEKESDFPKFNVIIQQKVSDYLNKNNLDNFSLVHFRDWDDIGDAMNSRIVNNQDPRKDFYVRDYLVSKDLKLPDYVDPILKKISGDNSLVYICSNNMEIKNFVKNKFENFISFDEDPLVTLRRNYSQKEYWDYCLIEFCLIMFCKEIHLFTNYSWITNFISYGVLQNAQGVFNPYQNSNFVKKHGEFLIR